MKSIFLILTVIIGYNSLIFAQESEKKKKIIPINEFTISLNRTTVADKNTQDRFGFGAGLYYAFFNQKRCNLITGLEYNRNVQFKKSLYGGRSYNYYNVTYIINYLGIPAYFRVNIGKRTKFFVETGAFFDFLVFGKTPDKVNFGISGGIGLRIPIQKHEILLKGDYKWGMRNLYDYHDYIYNKYWRFTLGFKANF